MNTHQVLSNGTPRTQKLLSASFNQDQGCFAIGYENGFRVYGSDPLELKVKRDFSDGGIGLAKMLHRTNYIALVGGGRNPKYPENKVIIWDDIKHKVALSLEFLSPVLNVLLSRTRIVIVLKSKVLVYAFSSPPSRIMAYDTVDNPHGIAVLSNNVLVFPSRSEGQVQIVNLSGVSTDVVEQRNLVSILRAHRSGIRCLALNDRGTVLATTSETGTIIRLYSTSNTVLLHEFRRGLDKAVILSMAFSPSSARLAILSDKSTLHVFNTVSIAASLNSGGSGATNRKHVLGRLPLMPKYFSSEWSFVSARTRSSKGVLGWSAEDSIVIVWTEECIWEKFVITEREVSSSAIDSSTESKLELIREAWRGFEDLRN